MMFNYIQHVTKSLDFSDLAKCLEEIKELASRNYIKLNDSNTHLLCVSKKICCFPIPIYLKLMRQTLKVENCEVSWILI